MTIYPQAILGMIEVDSANDELEMIVTGGGSAILTPSRNTYANIIDLVYDLNSQFGQGGSVYFTDESTTQAPFHVVLDYSPSAILSVVDGNLKDILGSTVSIVDGNAVFDYRPLNSWVPTYRASDGNWFKTESGSVVNGTVGVSGNLSGIEYTARQKVTKEWPFVLRENVFAGSGTDDELRSFETVVNGARANVLKYSDSNNIYCKGVYYIHSIGDYVGFPPLTTWDDGKPNGETFVFCTADAPNTGDQSDSRQNTRYNVSLTLTTATAPSWDN